jgi:hypothetical protein
VADWIVQRIEQQNWEFKKIDVIWKRRTMIVLHCGTNFADLALKFGTVHLGVRFGTRGFEAMNGVLGVEILFVHVGATRDCRRKGNDD